MYFSPFTSPLAGLGQGLGFPTTGFPTTGFLPTGIPTTGFPTTGFPTTGFPTTGFPTTGFPTTGFPTTGFPTTGFPTTGFPTTGFPTTGFPSTTGFGQLQCFTGRVNILVFIQPSDIVATLTTQSGQTILLTTNRPIIRQQLGQVDQEFATVCGTFVIRNNRLVLDVQAVIPQQVFPPSNLQQLLLLLLLLLLLRGQLGSLGGTGLGRLVTQFGGQTGLQQALSQLGGATGVTRLVNQLGGEAAITSQLRQAGIF